MHIIVHTRLNLKYLVQKFTFDFKQWPETRILMLEKENQFYSAGNSNTLKLVGIRKFGLRGIRTLIWVYRTVCDIAFCHFFKAQPDAPRRPAKYFFDSLSLEKYSNGGDDESSDF